MCDSCFRLLYTDNQVESATGCFGSQAALQTNNSLTSALGWKAVIQMRLVSTDSKRLIMNVCFFQKRSFR